MSYPTGFLYNNLHSTHSNESGNICNGNLQKVNAGINCSVVLCSVGVSEWGRKAIFWKQNCEHNDPNKEEHQTSHVKSGKIYGYGLWIMKMMS